MRRRAPIPLAGRVIAITGGSRGIGAATARELAARGARVVVGDLDPTGAALPLDVTDRASFEAFLAAAEERHGPVDVLVNNAGVMHVGPFVEESDDWTRRQVDINLHGVILGMKLALPGMLARGRGHVVNVASMASQAGIRHEAVYAATKHAVYGLSDSVRQELRGTSIELSVVMPGLVRTELASGTLEARGSVVLSPGDVAEAIADALERPRFDVFVPRRFGALARVLGPLPRGAREAILRLAGTEGPAKAATPENRAAYEQRVAALYDPDRSG